MDAHAGLGWSHDYLATQLGWAGSMTSPCRCPPRTALITGILRASTVLPVPETLAQSAGGLTARSPTSSSAPCPASGRGDRRAAPGRPAAGHRPRRLLRPRHGPAAEYAVRCTLPGFEPQEMRVAVAAAATVSLDVVLEIERLIEAVSVIADEPTVFATNVVAEPILEQQAAITSVVTVVDTCRGRRCRRATPTGSTTGRARSPSAASRPTSTRRRSAPPSTGSPTAPPTTGAGPRGTVSSTPRTSAGRSVAGHRRRRLAVGRGPGRRVQLHHRRARRAGRHRLALRPRDLCVAVGGAADHDRQGARRCPERARAPRRQARVVARPS